MKQDLSTVLDESLALLAEGQITLEECLSRYPEHGAELRPLLKTFLQLHDLPRPTSSPAAFDDGKRRMLEALAEKLQRQEQTSQASAPQRVPSAVRGLETRDLGYARAPALRTILAVTLVMVLLGVGSLVMLYWPGGVVDHAASVAHVSGVVEFLPVGSETWQPLAAGEQVQVGDRVRTGPQSAVMLVFFDGSTSSLGAEADVTLAQMRSRREGDGRAIVLRQWLGHTFNVVQPDPARALQFEIETPAAVIVVSSAEFEVSVEVGGATDVTVVAGIVDVVAQGTTARVLAGRGVTVRPEHAPAGTRPESVNTPTPWPVPSPAGTEPSETQDQPASEESPVPTEAAEPAEPSIPAETLQPTGRPTPTPTETPGPVEIPSLGGTPTPIERPTPTETPRPIRTPIIVETVVPVDTPLPHATAQPIQTPRPTNTRLPHSTPKPIETPKPIGE